MSMSSPTPTTTTSTTKYAHEYPPLPPLTTPFIQPPSCASLFHLTAQTLWVSETTPLFVSDAANPRFSSCQPPGWDEQRQKNGQFSFSPAVCPSGWTYHGLRVTTFQPTNRLSTYTYSTAYCCASGYTYRQDGRRPPVSSITKPCYRIPSTGTKKDNSTLELTTAHEAWYIAWDIDDASTLSPSPPTLTVGQYVSTWVPGETIPTFDYDSSSQRQNEVPGMKSFIYFMAIGVPLMCLTTLVGCVWGVVVCRRHRRREKKQTEIFLRKHELRVQQERKREQDRTTAAI